MARRIETYRDAFWIVLDIPFSVQLKNFVSELEKEGHTEKSISYAIWKSQDKLFPIAKSNNFMQILRQEIYKWSWPKNDPRWQDYWKRKEEVKYAAKMRDRYKDNVIYQRVMAKIHGQVINPPKKGIKSYVYFVQGECGGPIKIGYSSNPIDRLKGLQTGHPDTLKILALVPGGVDEESIFHKKFKSLRLKGEWFKPSKELLQEIYKLKE